VMPEKTHGGTDRSLAERRKSEKMRESLSQRGKEGKDQTRFRGLAQSRPRGPLEGNSHHVEKKGSSPPRRGKWKYLTVLIWGKKKRKKTLGETPSGARPRVGEESRKEERKRGRIELKRGEISIHAPKREGGRGRGDALA